PWARSGATLTRPMAPRMSQTMAPRKWVPGSRKGGAVAMRAMYADSQWRAARAILRKPVAPHRTVLPMTSGITLSQLTADEKHLLSLLLAGEDEPFVSLRAQLAQLWVVARRESPTGVIVDVRIPDDVPRAPLPRLDLSDVGFEIGASKQRGTATVRVEGGAILQLEMVTPAGAW